MNQKGKLTDYTPGKWMKARIVKCSDKNHWHANKISEVIKVRHPGWDSAYYEAKTGESIPKYDVSVIIKLTERQKAAVRILRKYPYDIIMSDGWLTGGHGIRIDATTVKKLRMESLITNDRKISELGKTIEI